MFIKLETEPYIITVQNLLMVALKTLMTKVTWNLGLGDNLHDVSGGKYCLFSPMRHVLMNAFKLLFCAYLIRP